ncbi:RlpA-like double-psi beta-barrel-protein domain-containing protein-containing protein [Mycena vitilis]|nr:RlpA-like double-psi beta-barrel-protein domain-containing protein-containing protein [Mycena vitilis]
MRVIALTALVASWYQPDGGIGACGSVLQNSDFVVALGVDTWANGAHCGESVTVNYNGKSISVTVADRCAGCNDLHGADSIDLAEGAIAALDPNYVNDGLINVQWTLF